MLKLNLSAFNVEPFFNIILGLFVSVPVRLRFLTSPLLPNVKDVALSVTFKSVAVKFSISIVPFDKVTVLAVNVFKLVFESSPLWLYTS